MKYSKDYLERQRVWNNNHKSDGYRWDIEQQHHRLVAEFLIVIEHHRISVEFKFGNKHHKLSVEFWIGYEKEVKSSYKNLPSVVVAINLR